MTLLPVNPVHVAHIVLRFCVSFCASNRSLLMRSRIASARFSSSLFSFTSSTGASTMDGLDKKERSASRKWELSYA